MTTREGIIGQNLFTVFPDNPDDKQATGTTNLRASLQSVLANRAPHTMAVQQYDIRRPNGSFVIKYWSPLNTPVLDSAGEVMYIIHRVEDVTEYVTLRNTQDIKDKKHNELVAKADAMEVEIYKRAQEIQLANTSLVEEVAERKRIEQDLEMFTYSASHDLKSPLRVIDGFAELLDRNYSGQLGDDGGKLLTTISKTSRRMIQLIDDLLKFSKLNKTNIKKETVDMPQMAKSVIAELQDVTVPGTTFEVGDMPPVHADALLIHQVYFNLISNAVKYSSKTPAPAIHVGATITAGETVYFVKDNGAGFSMKYAGKLFQVFQRLHSTSEYEGTGLGLSIVAAIITKHGGRIWAEAEEGKGATFFFTIAAAS